MTRMNKTALVQLESISGRSNRSDLAVVIAADNALLPGVDRCLGAVGQVQFAQDIADMSLNRIFANDQLRRDLIIVLPIRDQFENFHFPVG